jgi:predicted nucleotidyltransferase
MDRADVIARLRKAEPALKARGIASLSLFGSYARDKAGLASDIDPLAEIAPGSRLSILDMLDAQSVIKAEIADKDIFLVTRENIVPLYLPSIEATAMNVF